MTLPRSGVIPRIKCFIAVQLRPESDHGLILDNLSDVSLGGCGVESAIHVSASTPVALSPLTAAGELWVRGVVANSRFSEGTSSFHIGIRFLEESIPCAEHRPHEFVQFVEQAAAHQNPGQGCMNRPWGCDVLGYTSNHLIYQTVKCVIRQTSARWRRIRVAFADFYNPNQTNL